MSRSTKSKIVPKFLFVIKTGFWGALPGNPPEISQKEWTAIWKMAQEQAVTGLIGDALPLLPEEAQPDEDLTFDIVTEAYQIEKQNKTIDEKVRQIFDELRANDIRGVLLKGQGIAREYLHPEHRLAGDIDIYVGAKQIDKARRYMEQKTVTEANENRKHIYYKDEGIQVELHRTPTGDHFFIFGRRQNKWFCNELERTCRQYENVNTPSEMFNVVFEYYHAFHHFTHEGVGFRQILDWVVCLHNYRARIDHDQLRRTLYRMGLLHSWRVFIYIAVHALGLPREEAPFYDPNARKKATQVIWKIVESGNFGKNYNRTKRSTNYFVSKAQGVRNNIADSIQLARIFPTDAMRNLKSPTDMFWKIVYDVRYLIIYKGKYEEQKEE